MPVLLQVQKKIDFRKLRSFFTVPDSILLQCLRIAFAGDQFDALDLRELSLHPSQEFREELATHAAPLHRRVYRDREIAQHVVEDGRSRRVRVDLARELRARPGAETRAARDALRQEVLHVASGDFLGGARQPARYARHREIEIQDRIAVGCSGLSYEHF